MSRMLRETTVTSADERRARAVWREGEAGKVPRERPEGAREEREAFTRLHEFVKASNQMLQIKCAAAGTAGCRPTLLRGHCQSGAPTAAKTTCLPPEQNGQTVESRIWVPRTPAHGSRSGTRCGPRTRWSAAQPEKGRSTAARCPRTSLRCRCRAPDARPKAAPGTRSTRVVQNGRSRDAAAGRRGRGWRTGLGCSGGSGLLRGDEGV